MEKINVNEKLKFRESLFYSIGNGSITLIAATMGVILVYYTYVVGISAGIASTVLGISRIFDGVSDIIMGRIVDKTHSKYGKARPWFIRMMVPMSLSVVACFFVPENWGTMAQAIYMFVTYNLANTVCVTALSVANGALNGFTTLDQGSRGFNGALCMLTNVVANTIFTSFYLKLAKYFGGGDQYSQKGWVITMLIFALAYIPLLLVGFFGTKERVTLAENSLDYSASGQIEKNDSYSDVKLKEALIALFKNKYWVITFVAGFLLYSSMNIGSSSLVYFADYVMGDINLQSTLYVPQALGMLLGIVISIPLMKKMGKRFPMILGMILGIIFNIPMILSKNITLCIVCMAIKGLCFGISAAPMGSFVHDALTYGLWKFKLNCTGIGSSATSMASKIGAGVSSVLLGALLEISGFVSGGGAQTSSAVSMINFLFLFLPIIINAIVIFVLLPYDLDKKYPAIVSDLNQGKYAEDSENNN